MALINDDNNLNLLGIVIITNSIEMVDIKQAAPFLELATLYLVLRLPGAGINSDPIYYQNIGGADWKPVDNSSSGPYYRLFLDEQEIISGVQFPKLLNYLTAKSNIVIDFNVEKHLEHEELLKLAWVTTAKLYSNPPGELLNYYSREIRLVPNWLMNNIHLSFPDETSFVLSLKSDIPKVDHITSNIAITRKSYFDARKESKTISDRDIFRFGHQKYFQDHRFCREFRWPHSIYDTIRQDHLPGILEGLLLNLSSPQLALHALMYLMKFRKLDQARKLIDHVPLDWIADSVPLANIMAAVSFMLKRNEQTKAILRKALRIFPDDGSIRENYDKLMALMDNDYMGLEEKGKRNNGQKEGSSSRFLTELKRIRDENQGRTATISLCMVVKDEEQYICRAIESVRDVVDEIIVVDTGSVDQTTNIAKRYGAELILLDGLESFSTARNLAIKKAKSDYVLMLDGDEYFSPFHFIELQLFKKLLPLKTKCSFRLNVGTYFNNSDWLFMVNEEGNFLPEIESVRIFPNIPGNHYRGEICEELILFRGGGMVDELSIPSTSLYILHDSTNRTPRIRRKLILYEKSKRLTESFVLRAIKDYSYLGMVEETVLWMKAYLTIEAKNDEKQIEMGIFLARLLENRDPQFSADLLWRLNKHYPEEESIHKALAEFLINKGSISKLGQIRFHGGGSRIDKKDKDYACYTSLAKYVNGEGIAAIGILEKILLETPANILGQTIRYYYLVNSNEIEGALNAIEQLTILNDISPTMEIDSLETLEEVIENIGQRLIEMNHQSAAGLLIQGTLKLRNLMSLS
jgi:glycosyltransferase involved in cell wall biosynthesis